MKESLLRLKPELEGVRVAFCLTASYCTLEKAVAQMDVLRQLGCRILPVISFNVRDQGSRFGSAEYWRQRIVLASGTDQIIDSIALAEPIGPQQLADVLVIAPMSGNTCAKLALGLTDTPVLMAAKSHLRICRPVVLSIASNDALSNNAVNMGRLFNSRHIYFVPFGQDDAEKKPNSLIAQVELLPDTLAQALQGRQLQPMLTYFA